VPEYSSGIPTRTGPTKGFSAKGGVETKVWLLRHEGAAGLLI